MKISNKKEHVGSGGVTLENIQVRMHSENVVPGHIIEFIILCAGVFGAVFSFILSFSFSIDRWTYILILFVMCFFWYVVFNSRAYAAIAAGAAVLALLAGGISYRLLSESYNCMLDGIYGRTAVEGSIGPDLILLLFAGIFTMAISYAVIVRPNMYLAAATTLPLCALSMFWNKFPPMIPLVCVGMYLAAMAAISKNDGNPKKKSNIIAGAAGGLVLLIYIGVIIFLPEAGYTRVAIFENIRSQVQSDYVKPDYRNLIEKNFDQLFVGGVNGGELGRTDKVEYQNRPMIRVTTGTISDVLYLRGYVGAVYENNRWNDLPENYLSKYARVFNLADDSFIDIYSQTAELMTIIDNDAGLMKTVAGSEDNFKKTVLKRKFSLEYLDATQRYWYLPYGSLASGRNKSTRDGYPVNIQSKFYESYAYEIDGVNYQVYKDLIDNYNGDNEKLLEYITWETKYRNMVHRVYTEIPDSYLTDLRKKVAEYTKNMDTEKEKQEFIEEVKKYLAANYTYTLEPGAVPQGRDFVEYFLYDSRQGYCTYFASAAVMIFRAAGIPARYVEGYVADTNDSENTDTAVVTQQRGSQLINVLDTFTQYSVSVMDRSAHAWVEIYEDGYGWVPVEVTPGMNGLSYLNNDISNSITDIEQEDYGNVQEPGYQENYDESDSPYIIRYTATVDFKAVFRTIREVMTIVAEVVLAIFLVFSVYYIVHLIKRRKLDRAFDKERTDLQAQVIEIYAYVERICRFLRLNRPETMSYKEYALYLNKKNDGFTVCNIDKVMNLVLKVRFGSKEAVDSVTKEDVAEAIDSVVILKENIYRNSGRIGKLVFRLFYHLY